MQIPGWFVDIYSDRTLATLLYWLPLAFCVFGYMVRTARNFRKDRSARLEPANYYRPTDTIGTLIGRAVVSLLPIGNLFAAVFDLAPEVFGRFFRWIGRVFDQPLVPDLPDGRKVRGLDKQ